MFGHCSPLCCRGDPCTDPTDQQSTQNSIWQAARRMISFDRRSWLRTHHDDGNYGSLPSCRPAAARSSPSRPPSLMSQVNQTTRAARSKVRPPPSHASATPCPLPLLPLALTSTSHQIPRPLIETDAIKSRLSQWRSRGAFGATSPRWRLHPPESRAR